MLTFVASAGAAFGEDHEDAERGRELFENACANCHGSSGEGSRLGPSLAGSGAAGVDFMLSTGRMPLDDPLNQPVRKPPAFDRKQIAQITKYVASLGTGPEIPDVDPTSGDLAAGQELYAANCAACHSSAGTGGAVGAGLEAPPLHKATPVEIVEAMRFGPGTMPVFDPQSLSEEEANSITRYLLYLRDLPDAGGWGLGRVGPIAEGLVAWLVAMGGVLLICRWIGE